MPALFWNNVNGAQGFDIYFVFLENRNASDLYFILRLAPWYDQVTNKIRRIVSNFICGIFGQVETMWPVEGLWRH